MCDGEGEIPADNRHIYAAAGLKGEEEARLVGVAGVLSVVQAYHRLTLAQLYVQHAVVGNPRLTVADGAVGADELLDTLQKLMR